MSCSPWGCKGLDMTEQLNNNTNNATPPSSTITSHCGTAAQSQAFSDGVPETPCTSQRTPALLHLFLRKLKISQVVASSEISHNHNRTPITQSQCAAHRYQCSSVPSVPKVAAAFCNTNMGLTLVFPSCSFSLLMSVCDGIKYVTNS